MAGGFGSEFLVIIPAIFLMNQLDLKDPIIHGYLRMAFGLAVSVSFLVMWYIEKKVKSDNDTREIRVPKLDAYQKPIEGEFDQVTVASYDLAKIADTRKQNLMSMVIIGFVDYQWGVAQLLGIQCVMQLSQLYGNPMFKLHILQKESVGDLARPFPAPSNPLASLFGGGGGGNAAPTATETPTATATETEKKEGEGKGEETKEKLSSIDELD